MSRGCIIPGTPDVAFVDLEFGSGTIAHIELSWLAPSKLRRTAVVGSRKMVIYDDTSGEPVRDLRLGRRLRDPESFGEFRLSYRTGDIVSPRVEDAEPLQLELADFCASVRDGSEPRSSPKIGLDVVRMIEAVESRSNRAGCGLPWPGARSGSTVHARIDCRVPLSAGRRRRHAALSKFARYLTEFGYDVPSSRAPAPRGTVGPPDETLEPEVETTVIRAPDRRRAGSARSLAIRAERGLACLDVRAGG